MFVLCEVTFVSRMMNTLSRRKDAAPRTRKRAAQRGHIEMEVRQEDTGLREPRPGNNTECSRMVFQVVTEL